MVNIHNKRVLETLYKLHHNIMMNITEDKNLGTVGSEYKEKLDIAESSSQTLALKISKKG